MTSSYGDGNKALNISFEHIVIKHATKRGLFCPKLHHVVYKNLFPFEKNMFCKIGLFVEMSVVLLIIFLFNRLNTHKIFHIYYFSGESRI